MSGCVTPPTALVPCGGAIPGFTGRRVPVRSVVVVAPRQVSGVLRSASGDAVSFDWAAASGHGRLLVAAWQLTGGRTATRVLGTWRASVAKRHPLSLKLADGGFLVRAGGTKAPALAVVRVGPVVAALRFQTSASGQLIDDFMVGEAGTEARQLSEARGQTGFELLSYHVYQHHGPTAALALQALALIGGRGPGVPKPVPNAGFVDGTVALDWVLEELPRFSKPQRRAVEAYLARTFPQHASSAIKASRQAHVASPTTTAADYQAIADQMLARIETHTGPLGITPVVAKGTTSTPGEYAVTNVFFGCAITVYQTNDARPLSFKQHTLAHELGHCMQSKYGGVLHATSAGNVGWLLEGLPEWIADEVVPLVPSENPLALSRLTSYDLQPGLGLDQLDYDAVGFFGHVADAIGENTLWNRIPQIMTVGDTPEGLTDTVQSNAQEVYDTWGGSYAQRPDLGPKWMRINPYPATQIATGEQIIQLGATKVIVPAGSVPLAGLPASGSLYQVSATEPFLRIDPQGELFGRLADSSGMDLQIEQTAGHLYCTIESCDACPPGTVGTPPPSEPLTTPLLIGLSGGTPPGSGGNAVLTGVPWSKFCHHRTLPPGGGGGGSMGCGTGVCASSGGDPHLSTFAGDAYDFQAAGEFTLLKSTTDDLEIQERQQPFLRSSAVAINTAVAMRVAGAIVEVDAGRSPDNSLVLWLNKRRVPAQGSLRLRGGGVLSANNGMVTVSWPDGTKAQLFSGGASAFARAYCIYVAVKVAPGRVGHLTGLLGDAGAASGTEFVGRDGRHYSADVALGETPANFKLLYRSFGQSWRIRQRDSLFVYPRGKDTNSYTIKGFPSHPENVLSLSPAAFGSGEHACTTAGVTDPVVLGDCIVDVGATGDTGFAGGAAHLQGVTGGLPASAGGVSPVGWTELSSVPDTDTLLTPSLAPAGASIVAAFRAGGATSVGAATFTPTAAGIGAVVRSTPFTGWSSISDPLLFPAPGGGLQMIFGGLNNSPALSGTLIAQRQPDGSFGQPSNTDSGPESNLSRGAVLAADGVTPVWTATYGPYLKLERGGGSPVETDLSSLVPGAAYVPTLAHDQSGRLWMAWYEIANNPAQSGLYLLQLDPSGDGVAPGAKPLLAPGSQTSDNLTAQPALACAAACRLVYEDTGTNTQLDSWTPGEVRPTAIASDSQGFSDPTAAYTADRRLWVTWAEPHSARLLAKLGDATGAGGSPILTLTPPGYGTALNTASTVAGTQLLLATNWQTDSSRPTTAVFATVINAGR
jgi:hypothetical protein